MSRRSYEHEFPRPVKLAVKHEQQNRCLYCNGLCRGHHNGEPNLEVHHIIPVAAGGAKIRENAAGLCDHKGNNCHHHFDALYFKEGKTVIDVLMEEGRWYDLRHYPGIKIAPKMAPGD